MAGNIFKLKTSSGEILCDKMILAESFLGRLKGLMFSGGLPDCDGFLIRPCNSIHTFFMRYPLDVIFLDQNFNIVKVLYDLKPWRMTWIYFRSYQVLEMKAGTLRPDLRTGEKLEAICIS